MIKVCASVLAADILHLEEDVRRVLNAGADLLHLDIMDAHFVPNLSFGPDLVAGLRRGFPDVYLDVHLMMTYPEDYIQPFVKAGASAITLHAEIGHKALDTLRHIRSLGLETGISFKPGTPISDHQALLALSDLVLLMTVEPGFGGQKLMPEVLEKISHLRQQGFTGAISVDGGVNPQTAPLVIQKGADWLVMGTGLFRAEDPAQVIRDIRAVKRG